MKRLLSIVSLSICCISVAAHLPWLANAPRGGGNVAKNAMPMISPSQCSDFAILDNGDKSEDYAEPSVADFFKEVFPIKGYADTLTMRHCNNGTTPDSLRGYQITLTDAQTIRLRCLDFHYTRGLGTGMPEGKLPLDVRLYDDTSAQDSLKASFRWYVEGKGNLSADTTAVDTSGLVLSPGTYFLVYGGYLEDAMRDTDIQMAMVIQGEQSAITVVMESLPLLPPPEKEEVKGWNTITDFTSRDGSLYNGESLQRQYDDFGRLSKSI